jgi:hypothetical protein
MTTADQDEVAELELRSQEFDEVAASIAAIEKVVLGSAPRREAIHELGCKIVAQALSEDGGSGEPMSGSRVTAPRRRRW